MPVLVFSGDFVASQFSLDEVNSNKTDAEVDETPFLATDIVRITIKDSDVGSNGEFDDDLVRFTSFTVERDGVVYEFGVDSGSKVKESGGGSAKEQGDTYFVTNDAVAPPSSGPFSGLEEQEYLFSSDTSFADGPDTYRLDRKSNDVEGIRDGNFNIESVPLLCFAAGTQISTEHGPRRVEALSVGDRIWTADNGLQPLLHVTRSHHRWSQAADRDKPIMIKQGALGAGLPARDLVVSPQHRMLMPHPSEQSTCFCAARHLTALPSVRQMQGLRAVSYVHLVLKRHEIIFAEGAPTESFFPGVYALKALCQSDRDRVHEIFPESPRTPGARPFVSGIEARNYLGSQPKLWSADRLGCAGLIHPHNEAAA